MSTPACSSVVSKMLNLLHVTEDQLLLLRPAVLEKAAAQLELHEMAAFDLYLRDKGVARSDEALVAHFQEEERRRVESWRPMAARLEEERKALLAEEHEARRQQFIDLARNGLVSMEDAMAAAYLLFGTDEAVRVYTGIVLRRRDQDRILAHNFYCAAQMEPSFLARYGAQLLTFPLPLFPPVREMSALNLRMLESVDLMGGGASGDQFFRRSRASVEGGGLLPVVSGPDGTPVVDTTHLEGQIKEAFDQAFGQLRQLQSQLAAEKASAAAIASCGQLRQQVTQAHRVATRAYQYQQTQRGRGGRGAGGRGRGGRGRPQWGAGAESTEDPKNE